MIEPMFTIVRLAATTLIALLPLSTVAPHPEAVLAAADATVVLHDSDVRWEPDIRDALDRFNEAGLQPIEATVHVWDRAGSAACDGHAGLFSQTAHASRVDLCIDYLDSPLGTHLRMKLILHELGHAWIQVHTDPDQRARFMRLRATSTWNDHQTPHYARGAEVATNTLVAMLHPDEPAHSRYLCGYELLVGAPSVPGRTDPCSADRQH